MSLKYKKTIIIFFLIISFPVRILSDNNEKPINEQKISFLTGNLSPASTLNNQSTLDMISNNSVKPELKIEPAIEENIVFSQDVKIDSPAFENESKPLDVSDIQKYKKLSFRMRQLRSYIASASTSPLRDELRKKYPETFQDFLNFQKLMDEYMGTNIKEDETLADDIHFQSGKRAQAGVELIANAIDAMGDFTGRFGIGFLQILQELESEDDSVEVCTKKDGQAGLRIIFMKINGEYRISFVPEPSLVKSGTSIHVMSNNFKEDKRNKLINYVRRKIRLNRKLKILRKENGGIYLMNHLTDFKMINGNSAAKYKMDESSVLFELRDDGYTVRDFGRGMSLLDVLEKLIPSRRSNNNYWFRTVETSNLQKQTAIFYKDTPIDKSDKILSSQLSVLINGYEIETHNTKALNLPEEFVLDLPIEVSQVESRDNLIFTEFAVKAFKHAVDKITADQSFIETKVKLFNAIFSMIGGFAQNEKNLEYTKQIQNYCKKSFREKVIPLIDQNNFQMLPNSTNFEGITTGKKKPLFIHEDLIRWSLPSISGMKLVEDFVSDRHRLFTGNWQQGKNASIYVKIGNDLIINEAYFKNMQTILSRLLINLLWNVHTSYGERASNAGKLVVEDEWFRKKINGTMKPKIDEILEELGAGQILSKTDFAGVKLVFTGLEEYFKARFSEFLKHYNDIKQIIIASGIPLERVGFVKFIKSSFLRNLIDNSPCRFENIDNLELLSKFPNIMFFQVGKDEGSWGSRDYKRYKQFYDIERNEWMVIPGLDKSYFEGNIYEFEAGGNKYLYMDRCYEYKTVNKEGIFTIDNHGRLKPVDFPGTNEGWFKSASRLLSLKDCNVSKIKRNDGMEALIDFKTNKPVKLPGLKDEWYNNIYMLWNQSSDRRSAESERYHYGIFVSSKGKPFLYDFEKYKKISLENFDDIFNTMLSENEKIEHIFDKFRLNNNILTLTVKQSFSSDEKDEIIYWNMETGKIIPDFRDKLPASLRTKGIRSYNFYNNNKEYIHCSKDNDNNCIFDVENNKILTLSVDEKKQQWFSDIETFEIDGKNYLKFSRGNEFRGKTQCAIYDFESGDLINLPYSDKGWFDNDIEIEHCPVIENRILAIKRGKTYLYVDIKTLKPFDFSIFKGMPEIKIPEPEKETFEIDFSYGHNPVLKSLEHVNPLNGKIGDYYIFSNGIIVNWKTNEFVYNYVDILERLFKEKIKCDFHYNFPEAYISSIMLDRYVLLNVKFDNFGRNRYYTVFDLKTGNFIDLPDELNYSESAYAVPFRNRIIIQNRDRHYLYDFITQKPVPLPNSHAGYFQSIKIVNKNTLIVITDSDETYLIDFSSEPSLKTGDVLNDEIKRISSAFLNDYQEEFSDDPKLLEKYLSNLLKSEFSKLKVTFDKINPLLPFLDLSNLFLLTDNAINVLHEKLFSTASFDTLKTFSVIFETLKGRVNDPVKFSAIVLRWMELILEDEKEARYIGNKLKDYGNYFDTSLELDTKKIKEGYLSEYIEYLLGFGEILSRKRNATPLNYELNGLKNRVDLNQGISLAQLILAVQNRRNILQSEDLNLESLETVLNEFHDWNQEPVKGEIFSTIFGQDPDTWIRECGQNARDIIREALKNKSSDKNDALIEMDSYIDEDEHWAFTITDPVGVGLKELINLFFIPGESGKRGKQGLSGKFGKGLLTILANADEVEVITSPEKDAFGYRMTLNVIRNENNQMQDVRITNLEQIKTQFKGTQLKRIKYKPRQIESLKTSRAVYRYLSGISEQEAKVKYKGVLVNENFEEVGFSDNEGIGRVVIKLSPYGFPRIMVDGLYLDEITDERLIYVHEIIKKMFYEDELVISLSDKITLLSTRGATGEDVEEKIRTGIAAAMLKSALTLFIQKGRRIPDLPRDFFLSTEEQNYPDQEKLARIERDANLINDEKWNEVDFTPYTGTKRDIIQLLIRVRDIHNSKTLKEIKQIEDTSFFSLTAGKGFFKSESYHKMQAIFASRLRNEKPDDDSSQSDANKNLPALTEDEMYLVQQATYALSALAGYPQTNVGAVQDNANVEAKAGVRKGIHEQPVTFIGWNIASPQVVLSLKNFCRIVQNKKIPVKERYYALYNFFDTILHEITHFSDKDNMSHEAEGIIDDAFITRFKSLIEKFIRSELSPEKFLDFLKDSVKDKNINPLEYDFSLPEYTRNIKRRNLLAKAA